MFRAMKLHLRKTCIYVATLMTAIATVSTPATAQTESQNPKNQREWLVKRHSQLSTNGDPQPGTIHDVARIGLKDGDPIKDTGVEDGGGSKGAPWFSVDDESENAERNYIQIDLDKPLNEILNGNKDLVVYTKRHTRGGVNHPTGFEVQASTDGKSWEKIAYAYFLYRGNLLKSNSEYESITYGEGTKEYSSRLEIPEAARSKQYKFLRFYVIANNTKTRVNNTSRRSAMMSSFNVMAIAKDANYSQILVDRFHLLTDYSYKYYNYDFIPTFGIFNDRNKVGLTCKQLIDDPNSGPLDLTNYTEWPTEATWHDSPWMANVGMDSIYWHKDLDYLKNLGIEMPVYKKLTNKTDSRIANKKFVPLSNKTGLASEENYTEVENWRQPAHEVEHVLYAIPGDAIALYPYYEIGNDKVVDVMKHYFTTFAHWYNYRTGGNVVDENGTRVLDFLTDPSFVCKSQNFGYYGGLGISGYTKTDAWDPSKNYIEYDKKITPNGTVVSYSKKESNLGDENMITVKINSVEGLIEFQEEYNKGKYSVNAQLYVQLGAVGTVYENGVFDFTGVKGLKPIGNDDYPFSGIFDGKWCPIKNYVADGTTMGIFGKINPETTTINKFISVNNSSDESIFITNLSIDKNNKHEKSVRIILKSAEDFDKFNSDYNSGKYNFAESNITVELDPSGTFDFTTISSFTKLENFKGVFDGHSVVISGKTYNDIFDDNLDGKIISNLVLSSESDPVIIDNIESVETINVKDGVKTQNAVIRIKTEKGFVLFQQAYNRGEYDSKTVNVELASKTGSFDFSKISEKMEPIGVIYNEYDDTQKHPFKGSFDGKGQRITNLHITGTNNVGLFGTVGSKTVIKNIYIDERCTFEGTGEHVGLIGQFYGKIQKYQYYQILLLLRIFHQNNIVVV